MSDPAIPRIAERALEALGAEACFRDAVIGDMAEEFAIRATWDGARVARQWYYRESLRVAPHLLGSWWRGDGIRGAMRAAGLIGVSYSAVLAFEFFIVRVVAPELGVRTEGMGVAVTTHSPFGAFVYLTVLVGWTLCDGVVAGYVAARIGRRAPLANAIACAAFWGTWMFAGNVIAFRGSAPLAYHVFNVLAMVGGVLIGGLCATARRSLRIPALTHFRQ